MSCIPTNHTITHDPDNFDGCSFSPYVIFTTIPITLDGKTISIEVEVIDHPLRYDLLLEINWTYVMKSISSIVFHTICFPHEGKIITFNHLDFFSSNILPNIDSNVPLIGDSSIKYDIVGSGLLKD